MAEKRVTANEALGEMADKTKEDCRPKFATGGAFKVDGARLVADMMASNGNPMGQLAGEEAWPGVKRIWRDGVEVEEFKPKQEIVDISTYDETQFLCTGCNTSGDESWAAGHVCNEASHDLTAIVARLQLIEHHLSALQRAFDSLTATLEAFQKAAQATPGDSIARASKHTVG